MAGDKPICGSPKKHGDGVCTQAPGWGTNHPGVGRCKLHGGSTPIKHGRYSGIKGALAEKMAKHAMDPDPANLIPELTILRALLEGWMDRNEDNEAAAIPGAVVLTDNIRKIVDTIHKMQTRELLTSREYEMALAELTRIIVEEVKDVEAVQRIAARFKTAFAYDSQSVRAALLSDTDNDE